MDIREKCRERATKFAIEYGFTNVSEHILDVCKANCFCNEYEF